MAKRSSHLLPLHRATLGLLLVTLVSGPAYAAKTPKQALRTLQGLAGTKWDAEVVETFVKILPTSHRVQDALRKGQRDHSHE